MPHYIVESHNASLLSRGRVVEGVQAPGCDGVYLYLLATEQNPLEWPQSPHGGTSPIKLPRRAPPGVRDWWIVSTGAHASWPATHVTSSIIPVDPTLLPEHKGTEAMLYWP